MPSGLRIKIVYARQSDKDGRRNTEALGKPLDLARIQLSLARQHFRDNALAADLRQVRLPQAVSLHQMLEDGGGRSGGYARVLGLVLLDKDADRIGELGQRVFFIFSDFVEDGVQTRDRTVMGLISCAAFPTAPRTVSDESRESFPACDWSA